MSTETGDGIEQQIPRPRVLWRYVFRTVVVAVGLAVLAVILVLLPGFALRLSVGFEGQGLGRGIVLRIFPALIPHALVIGLPLGALIGSTLAFSRMRAFGEITAVRSGGGSVFEFIRPALAAGALYAALYLALVAWGLEWSYSYIDHAVKQRTFEVVASQLSPGSSYRINLPGRGQTKVVLVTLLPRTPSGRKPLHISVFTKSPGENKLSPTRTKLLHAITAADHDLTVIPGPGGLPARLSMTMYDVTETVLSKRPQGLAVLRFEKKRVGYSFGEDVRRKSRIPLGRSMRSVFRNLTDAADMGARLKCEKTHAEKRLNTLGLAPVKKEPIRRKLKKIERDTRKEILEASRKFATALSIPLLVIMGIGFGLMVSRSSPFIGFVMGVLGFGLVYYPLMSIGMQLGLNGTLSPWFGPWLVDIVLLPVSIRLIQRKLVISGSRITDVFLRLKDKLRKADASAPTRSEQAEVERERESRARGGAETGVRRRMRLLPRLGIADHHVIYSFLYPFLGIYVGIALIFVGVDFVDSFDRIEGFFSENVPGISGGLEKLKIVVEYFLLSSSSYLLEFGVVPVLIGAVFGLVVAQRTGELIIHCSSGRSLRRAFLPVILAGGLLTAGITVVKEAAWSDIVAKRGRLLRVIRVRPPVTDDLFSVVSVEPDGSVLVFSMARYDTDAEKITGLDAYEFHETGPGKMEITAVSAPEADWNGEKWVFPKGGFLEKRGGVGENDDEALSETISREPRGEMRGRIGPDMIRYKRLGARFMSLAGLRGLPEESAATAEFHYRLSQFFLAFLLLPACLSLLVQREKREALGGLGMSVLLAGLFLAGRAAVRAIAGMDRPPMIAPLLIWGFFLVFAALAAWLYFRRMPT